MRGEKQDLRGRTAGRTVLALLVALAAAGLVAGCGGGGGGSESGSSNGAESSEASTGKAAFVKKANAACSKVRNSLLKEAGAYYAKHEQEEKNKPQGVRLANLFKAVYVPAVEEEIAAVRKFASPAGDKAEIEAMLAAESQVVDQIKKMKTAKSQDEFSIQFSKADVKLHAYGLDSCAKTAG